MSLTLAPQVVTGNAFSVWSIKLFNNTGGYFPIATTDFTGAVYFYPIIKNKPSIRTSIDLAKSTAKTSDVTLTCINEYLPSKFLSAELLHGTNNYINQEVVIYQSFEGNYNGVDATIYTGRLVDISHDHETCTLKIQSARPWDFITIPSNMVPSSPYGTTARIPTPVSYGNFTHPYGVMPTYANGEKVVPDFTMKPCRYFQSTKYGYRYLVGETNDSGKGQLFLYDKGLSCPVPIETTTSTSVGLSGAYYSNVNPQQTRGFGFRPNEYEDKGSSASFNNWSNESQAFDGDDDTDADSIQTITSIVADANAVTEYSFPVPEGKMTGVDVKKYIKWRLTSFQALLSPYWNRLEYSLDNATWVEITRHDHGDGAGVDTNGIYTLPTTTDAPDRIYIRHIFTQSASAYCQMTCHIKDIYAENEYRQGDDQEVPEWLYSYDNGFSDSWGGGGLCDQINEVHRDITIRYAGLSTSTPEGWSDLNTARADWKVRYWITEPTAIQKVLEKIQYEGAFIFTWTPDGGAKYIYVKTSYSSADHTLGDSDLSGVKISHTPFSELETRYKVRYQKHHPTGEYLQYKSDLSGGGSTIRDKWNIQAKENIKEIKLDAIIETDTGTDDIQEFSDYYFNIFGDIKIIVSGDIVNPTKWGVEIGDIVTFTDLELKAFNTDLGASNYFMITDLTRSVDSLKFKAREVG